MNPTLAIHSYRSTVEVIPSGLGRRTGYPNFENAFVILCRQLSVENLSPDPCTSPTGSKIQRKRSVNTRLTTSPKPQ